MLQWKEHAKKGLVTRKGAGKDEVSEYCKGKEFKKNEGLEEKCPFKTKRLPNISPYVIHGVM